MIRLEKFSSICKFFILMRILSAIFNPIDDCDEVFNFYEPVSQYLRDRMNLFDFSYIN
jgi:hypothetical protein